MYRFFGYKCDFKASRRVYPAMRSFAYQILLDLVAKASGHGTRVLGLFVDEDNKRAIKFYEHAGFLSLTSRGKRYRRMYVYLRDLS